MEKDLVALNWNIISILLGTVLRITIKIHGLGPWLEFHCHNNVYVTIYDTVFIIEAAAFVVCTHYLATWIYRVALD